MRRLRPIAVKLSESGQLVARRQQNRRRELLDLLQQQLMATLTAQFANGEVQSGLLEQVEAGVLDPYTAAQRMLVESSGLWR